MAKQFYQHKNFRPESIKLLAMINVIVEDYEAQGFRLTTRQLYYQLVARDIIANNLREYKRIAGLINDGKLAGYIDWDMIEDRTREFVRQQRWDNGAHILRAAVSSYHEDMWYGQDHRVFVIVEKEALVGVLEPTCKTYDAPLLAARGYPSGTVLREFVQTDLLPAIRDNKIPIILHLGDHDPSGIDMTRDLQERLTLFSHSYIEVNRIALTMDQIEEQRPPENPAKSSDSRFEDYQRLYGDSSWELDALSPTYLADLLRGYITQYIDEPAWHAAEMQVEDTKNRIIELAKGFE